MTRIEQVIKDVKSGELEETLKEVLIKSCCPSEFGIIADNCGNNAICCEFCWNEPVKED